MEQMSKQEWEESEKLSNYTLRQLGFENAASVRRALVKNKCFIYRKMSPINVDGELK